jgi:formate dehydrogenase iron-sulfur subunit
MRRCLHCLEPACVSACPTTALTVRPDGPVVYDSDPCIGCRYCILACPWGVPTTDWDTLKPKIHKCTHCADRCGQPAPASRNGEALSGAASQKFLEDIIAPACVKACPADALRFGEREEMLQEARRRIDSRPGKYVDHVYGEHEAGGTSWLYISDVPLETLGLKAGVEERAYPELATTALAAVPMVMTLWPPILMGLYAINRRRGEGERHDAEETNRE